MVGFGKRASAAFSSYPSGYTLGQVGGNVNNVRTNTAAQQIEAGSEDPGAYAIGSSVNWHALTIAVKPA